MSKKNHPTRLPAYAQVTVSSLAAASAVGTTEAAIVYFDVNPDQTLIGNNFTHVTFGNINLSTGTYSLGYGGNNFSIGMDFGGRLFSGQYAGTVQWGLSPTDYSGSTPFQPTRVQKLAFGTSISDISPSIGSWVDFDSYMLYNGTGPWVGGGDAYAPLRIDAGGGDYNYGWVNINFTDNGDGTSSSIITGFAFEDQINTAILAGDQGGPRRRARTRHHGRRRRTLRPCRRRPPAPPPREKSRRLRRPAQPRQRSPRRGKIPRRQSGLSFPRNFPKHPRCKVRVFCFRTPAAAPHTKSPKHLDSSKFSDR